MADDVLRIGVVDDDPLVVMALGQLFAARRAPIVVLWAVRSGEQALAACGKASLRPDCLLTDMRIPGGMHGLDLAHMVMHRYPDIAVVGFAAFPMEWTQERLAASGMSAVVSKDCSTVRLVRLLGEAAQCKTAAAWTGGPESRTMLSDAELRVLREFAEGRTVAAIAHGMNVSESTVKTHSRRAFGKLGVHSRSEALIRCARLGLL